MTSEVVNLRERIEKVRAEMAGESNTSLRINRQIITITLITTKMIIAL